MKELAQPTPRCRPVEDTPYRLYYSKVFPIDHPPVWMIGITSQGHQQRYSTSDHKHQELIAEWLYPSLAEAKAVEEFLKKAYEPYQFTGEHQINKGNTEVFTKPLEPLEHLLTCEPDNNYPKQESVEAKKEAVKKRKEARSALRQEAVEEYNARMKAMPETKEEAIHGQPKEAFARPDISEQT